MNNESLVINFLILLATIVLSRFKDYCEPTEKQVASSFRFRP